MNRYGTKPAYICLATNPYSANTRATDAYTGAIMEISFSVNGGAGQDIWTCSHGDTTVDFIRDDTPAAKTY